MNRRDSELAIQNIIYKLATNKNEAIASDNASSLIDEIYDDFENRKCQNCKYEKLSKERYLSHHQCLKLVSSVDYGFCCNRWESK